MTKVYVEARPKGRDGDPITGFVVEDHADKVLHEAKTQLECVTWAKAQGYTPMIARVRHLNDKKTPDHWRSPD